MKKITDLSRKNFIFIITFAALIASCAPPPEPAKNEVYNQLQLNQIEKEWIKDHPEIRLIHDPDYAPFEYRDYAGEYRGISSDYIDLVSKKTGLKFQIIHASNWQEALDSIKDRTADMLAFAAVTDDRKKYMLFTSPHYKSENVIITRKFITKHLDLDDLNRKRVATLKGWATNAFLKKNYPEMELVNLPNVKDILKKVSFGEVYATVLTLGMASYWIEQTGIANLRVAGETKFYLEFSFACRKDWPEFNSILEKCVNSFTQEEKNEINKKWVKTSLTSVLWTRDSLIIIFTVAGILILVAGAILAWIITLKKILNRKTLELQKELTVREKAEKQLLYKNEEIQAAMEELEAINERLIYSQKELEQSEKKYRLLADNVTDNIWEYDLKQNKLVYSNPAIFKITGYTAEEFVSMSPNDLVVHDYLKKGYKIIESELKKEGVPGVSPERSAILEAEMNHKDGYRIWAEIKSSFIRNSSGKIISLLGITRDITERKKAEKELINMNTILEKEVLKRTSELQETNSILLKAMKAAESATQAKSDFLANMSHEIRTPMNGVIAAADLAIEDEMPLKTKHYIDIIRSSGYTLLGIINDILDFSKIEAGKLELDMHPFSLDEMIYNVADLFAEKAAGKKIELLVDIYPNIPLKFIGDRLRIQQVLTNLISNAIKFTDESGTVILGIFSSENDKNKKSSALKFYVRDTGIGITPGQKEKLFQPFTQADTSTTRQFGGTGLGLTISKNLIEMMGGTITVESEYAEGTTFFINLKLKKHEAEYREKYIIPKELENLNILIADCSTNSADILTKILNSYNLNVSSTKKSSDVIKILENSKRNSPDIPGLLIMEMDSPELNGLETAEKIKTELKMTIPVIIISAAKKITDIDKNKRQYINTLITKPVHASTLMDSIMNIFGKTAANSVQEISPYSTPTAMYKESLKDSTVLVAEDNATNREIAGAILAAAGINVIFAKNGKEAVKLIEENSPDAVLMDIQMPEMDGLEATKIIRLNKKFDSIPIIAMTAHALKGDEERCIEAGMDGYVSKPVNQKKVYQELYRKIDEKNDSSDQNEIRIKKMKKVPEPHALKNKKFSDLPGIAVKKTIESLKIQWIDYKKILRSFLNNNTKTTKTVNNLFEKKDWQSLQKLSHDLKGSSANIGAFDLHKSAEALEKECTGKIANPDSSSPDIRNIHDLESKFNQVAETIRSIKQEHEKKKSLKKMESKAISAALKNLANSLIKSDPINVKINFEYLRDLLDDSALETINKNIFSYNYDIALKELSSLANRYEIKLI